MSKETDLSSSSVDDISQGISGVNVSDNGSISGSCGTDIDMSLCANCGKEGALNTCNKCKQVKYCNTVCKKKHKKKHKKECEEYVRRAAKKHEEELRRAALSYMILNYSRGHQNKKMIVLSASYVCQISRRGVVIIHVVEKKYAMDVSMVSMQCRKQTRGNSAPFVELQNLHRTRRTLNG